MAFRRGILMISMHIYRISRNMGELITRDIQQDGLKILSKIINCQMCALSHFGHLLSQGLWSIYVVLLDMLDQLGMRERLIY